MVFGYGWLLGPLWLATHEEMIEFIVGLGMIGFVLWALFAIAIFVVVACIFPVFFVAVGVLIMLSPMILALYILCQIINKKPDNISEG